MDNLDVKHAVINNNDYYLAAVIRDFNRLLTRSGKHESMDVDMTPAMNTIGSICYKVLAIDIGIKNLGLAFSIFNEDMTIREFNNVQLIDITIMRHKRVSRKNCTLHHDNCISDWISHVFQEWHEWFEEADYILIERQPIQGIVSVEQVIMHHFRNKTTLLSPTSMHQYFDIAKYEYDQRKEYTTKIALYYLTNETKTDAQIVDKFQTYTRCHDIADAICFTIYWSYLQNKEYKIKHRKERINEIIKRGIANCTMDEWFEQYMCRRTI